MSTLDGQSIFTALFIRNLVAVRWRQLYYDQKDMLTGRFGTTAVPAIVIQEGRRLRVREFPLGEEGASP